MISNSHIRLLVLAPLSCSAFLLAQSPPPQGSAAPVVLQKDEGELRGSNARQIPKKYYSPETTPLNCDVSADGENVFDGLQARR